MSSKRKRRKPEQVIRCLAEGESMLAAGKPAAEVYQKFGIAESTWMRWKPVSYTHLTLPTIYSV